MRDATCATFLTVAPESHAAMAIHYRIAIPFCAECTRGNKESPAVSSTQINTREAWSAQRSRNLAPHEPKVTQVGPKQLDRI